jgi:hypothetical protein
VAFLKLALKLVSFELGYLLLFPSNAVAIGPMDSEQRDFWQYMNDQDRVRYLQRRKQRREDEMEKIRQEDEKKGNAPHEAPTPVNISGAPLGNASDKTASRLGSTDDTTMGAQSPTSSKMLGGIKFADDADSGGAFAGDDSPDAHFVPTLKSDGKSKLDDKTKHDDDKPAGDVHAAMLDGIAADFSSTDDSRSARDKEDWRRLTEVHYSLQDWVPNTPDPTSNGGFGKEPDNGRPVPYHLNGHPDPERKLPWKTAD